LDSEYKAIKLTIANRVFKKKKKTLLWQLFNCYW